MMKIEERECDGKADKRRMRLVREVDKVKLSAFDVILFIVWHVKYEIDSELQYAIGLLHSAGQKHGE